MNISDILSEIDAEIARLQQAKAILGNPNYSGAPVKRKPGRPPSSASSAYSAPTKIAAKRTMSPEGRAKIAAAQKARWAKSKKTASASVTAPAKRRGRPPKSAAKKSPPSAKKSAAKSETAPQAS